MQAALLAKSLLIRIMDEALECQSYAISPRLWWAYGCLERYSELARLPEGPLNSPNIAGLSGHLQQREDSMLCTVNRAR